MICHGSRKQERGFTILELSFLVAIIAILAAIALPFYRDYVERAHLADVLVEYDAMREKAQIAAQESSRDLCNWKITWNGRDKDPETALIETIVGDGIKALDPSRWKPALTHFTSVTGNDQAAPLTVQFGGIGPEGVARTRLLAAEFQRIGAFNQWVRDSAIVATFTVLLGQCKSGHPASTIVATTVTQSPAVATPAPSCTAAQQLNADRSQCVPKVCAKGLVLDPASGACNPGCKPDEYEPMFLVRGGFTEGFNQPKSGPYICFNRTTEACPPERPMAGIKDGARICDPMYGNQPTIAAAPKPAGCSRGGAALSPFTEATLAQKLPYKAVDCAGNDPSMCEMMASPHGAVTCPAGSFPAVKLVNRADGTRDVERLCMPAEQCKVDYWRQSTQLDDCTTFDPSRSNTKPFQCTYCCAGDNCNGFDLDASGNKGDAYSPACPVNPALFVHWD
ncbi:hypothetical protein WG899_21460 [Paucibacter sp. AS339]|uniref:hypothetical protein n=1 Tax=Paucibacter hankyongi TaxID=3133434 RepID=UPI00309F9354